MKRRNPIPQRTRIFLGCEGESEQSYGVLLARLVERQHQRIFLNTVLLRPGGGDPLGLVQLAERKKRDAEKKSGSFAAAFVLLDSDKKGIVPARDQQAEALAVEAGLDLIWQEPCHEAMILRHLPNSDQMRPPTTALAISTLHARWPTFVKAMPASKLSSTLDDAHVRRARAVEPGLSRLLEALVFV
jgi:hypothetical protein